MGNALPAKEKQTKKYVIAVERTGLKEIPFEVDLKTINQELFKEERSHLIQELTRELIFDKLAVANSQPKRYGKPFRTISKGLGVVVNNIEQALEWAQFISNKNGTDERTIP